MADDPIDRMLEREDKGTARTQGTLSEARQSTADVARPTQRPESQGLINRILRMPPRGNRDQRRDSRE